MNYKEKKKTGIPILYYHSVADHQIKNDWSFLSISIRLFKKQMDYLYRNGYYTCNWQELEDHLNGLKKLPEKTVMFHFDDGFLDNWSVVFPIMKEKNFRYSIVITPEFIQKGNKSRPFVSETKLDNKKDWWGYLNETEIKIMSDSGLVDFQAHGYTHSWFEESDKLIDINTGTKFYPHLGWNTYPSKKPYWLTKPIVIPKAYPVFNFKKSLELNRRFFLNNELIKELIELYDENISKEDNLANYNQLIDKYRRQGVTGTYETEEEVHLRLNHELKDARDYISKITGKSTDYLVFPGGGNSLQTIDACKKAGYRLISKGERLNLYNEKIYQVNRYSATYTFPKPFNEILNIYFLQLQLKRAKGSYLVTKLFSFLRS